MVFEGRFWVLYEDEPIHIELTRVYDLKAGVVYDGRTGDLLGAYKVGEGGVDLTFLESKGDSDIIQFRSPAGTAFDPATDAYNINWTSAKYEEYVSDTAIELPAAIAIGRPQADSRHPAQLLPLTAHEPKAGFHGLIRASEWPLCRRHSPRRGARAGSGSS